MQGPLLVSPVCTDVSRDRRTCVKWFPSFNTSSRSSSSSFPAPGTKDVAMCGRAVINPAHILDPDSCTLGADGRLASACASHAGTKGQPADMYLYVSAVQDEQCARGAAAWALPCMFDPATNRPLLASANVCPFSLAGTTSTDLLVSIILHEVRCVCVWAHAWARRCGYQGAAQPWACSPPRWPPRLLRAHR